MKRLTPLILFIYFGSELFGQTSHWKETRVNEILVVSLPSNYEHSRSSYVDAYNGDINSNYFGLQFYDTVFNKISSERQFQIALTGFITGRLADTTLKDYSIIVRDSSFGKTKGVMVKLKATKPTESYKWIYYYITIANSKFYWFYVYCQSEKDDDLDTRTFFTSIEFDKEKVNERFLQMTKIYLSK